MPLNRFLVPLIWVAIGLSGVACSEGEGKLATVGGEPITAEQFEAYLEFKRIPAADDKRRSAMLEQYLEREALAGAIEDSGRLDYGLVQAELNEFRKEMLISRYFEQYLRERVTDEAVRNYYVNHPEEFQAKKVHVAHILVRTNREMSETERQAKLTAAQEAHSKIAAGEEFGEIAKQYSEDAVSAKKGGDIGWLKEGSIDPRFSETVFSTDAGEVTLPFETAFGFHVVKVLEGPTVVKRPFEAVQGDIRYRLRNQAKAAELKRLLAEARVERHD